MARVVTRHPRVLHTTRITRPSHVELVGQAPYYAGSRAVSCIPSAAAAVGAAARFALQRIPQQRKQLRPRLPARGCEGDMWLRTRAALSREADGTLTAV